MNIVDVDGIEELVIDRCQDLYMDPEEYLRRECAIRNEVMEKMTEFRCIQEERAKRFKLLYKALDDFDANKMYDEMKRMRKKKHVLTYLYNETAKFRALYKKGDHKWIQHRNYNDEFFDEYTGGKCCFEEHSYEEILSQFNGIFDLISYDSSD
jgi:hypothetical protein